MKSLRLRLLLGTLFWILLSLVVAGVGLGQMFHQHVSEQLYRELQRHLDQLTAQLEYDEQQHLQLTLLPSDPRFSKPLSGLYWQIESLEPNVLPLRSRSLWDQQLTLPTTVQPLQRLQLQSAQGVRLLALVRQIELDGQSLRLAVAVDEAALLEPMVLFQRELWFALALLGLGLVIAASVQVWMGLAPLQRLRIALHQVRTGKTQQLEGHFPQEVMPLVSDFNTVLSQNAEIVMRARTQAGNLAHALKTPLSILANAAYAEASNPLATLVNTQVSSARQHIDYHLARAQAAANAQVLGVHTVLQPVLDGLVRAMLKLHSERHLQIEIVPMSVELVFRGEQQDLQEMLGNLLDNACKWANSCVKIHAYAQAQQLYVQIHDDGEGVVAEQKQAVLQRGVRADERIAGSGLGLSIVADLAQMYGGELSLADSNLGGLTAELRLPLVTPSV